MKSWFSTPKERHAFLIGFSEVLCPWPPRIKYEDDEVKGEHHYYGIGRGAGVIAWILLAKLIHLLFW